jgi:hypothetical protein
MALITCQDCGGAVSDLAPACPHCGRPVAGTPVTTRPRDDSEYEIYRTAAIETSLAERKDLGEVVCIAPNRKIVVQRRDGSMSQTQMRGVSEIRLRVNPGGGLWILLGETQTKYYVEVYMHNDDYGLNMLSFRCPTEERAKEMVAGLQSAMLPR